MTPALETTVARTHFRGRSSFIRKSLWGLAFLIALVVSRVPLAPDHLITFDEINFALSLKQFNIALQQPQPPGYPLFVGILRLLSIFTPNVEHVFLVTALSASILALILLWLAGARLLGEPQGLIAALLLLFHPDFWFSALTNPVRLFFAVGATGVAFCLIEAVRRRSVTWFYAAAFVLGVAGGFRPTLIPLLLPLVALAAVRLRVRIVQIVLASGVLAAGVAPWLVVLVQSTGGLEQFFSILRTYSSVQGRSSSLLFGASLPEAAQMVSQAFQWTGAGALTWLWAVPFVLQRRGKPLLEAFERRFLYLWFIPYFLFFCFVHVGDPDHTLSIVPVTCILGAAVLHAMARARNFSLPVLVTGVVALNVFLFFFPFNKTVKAASYKAVRWLNGYVNLVLSSAQPDAGSGPVTVVFLESTAGWRNLSYYSPGVSVLVLAGGSPGRPEGWRLYGGRSLPLPVRKGQVLVPACGRLLFVDDRDGPQLISGSATATPIERRWVVSTTEPATGNSYRFRQYQFTADSELCQDFSQAPGR